MPAGPDTTVPVRLFGDPVLRRPCREVGPDEDVTDLAAVLTAAMADHDGVGLAAPQIGDERRVIAVGDPAGDTPPVVMVNPRLVECFGPAVEFEEGCLSFPDLFEDVWRPRGVEVAYRDPAGQEHTLRDDGITARIVQHELDHLDGVLFVDHLPRWRRWLLGWRLLQIRRRAGKAAA